MNPNWDALDSVYINGYSMTHGKEQHRTATATDRQAREGRPEAVLGLGSRRGLAPDQAVHRASGEAEECEMITFNGKQVIVIAVNGMGDTAVAHPVDALGTTMNIRIEDLRASTVQELEDALTSAPVLPTDEEAAELDALDSLAEEY